jgi:hypothetical protein
MLEIFVIIIVAIIKRTKQRRCAGASLECKDGGRLSCLASKFVEYCPIESSKCLDAISLTTILSCLKCISTHEPIKSNDVSDVLTTV